jgi:hypothetical protein
MKKTFLVGGWEGLFIGRYYLLRTQIIVEDGVRMLTSLISDGDNTDLPNHVVSVESVCDLVRDVEA